jgi:hypothetical protein
MGDAALSSAADLTGPFIGSGLLSCERVKQISHGKQRETQNTTPEIHVMTNAMLESPSAYRETGEVPRKDDKLPLQPGTLRQRAGEKTRLSFPYKTRSRTGKTLGLSAPIL